MRERAHASTPTRQPQWPTPHTAAADSPRSPVTSSAVRRGRRTRRPQGAPRPLVEGGGHEQGRAGTQNVGGIVVGHCVTDHRRELPTRTRIAARRDRLEAGLDTVDGLTVTGDERRVPASCTLRSPASKRDALVAPDSDSTRLGVGVRFGAIDLSHAACDGHGARTRCHVSLQPGYADCADVDTALVEIPAAVRSLVGVSS